MEVVDDTNPNRLTLSEVKELKRLANLSRTARAVALVLMAFVGAIGFPAVIDFFKAHWKWP